MDLYDTHKQRFQIVEVAADSLGRLASADGLVWLLDSGQTRERY